MRDLSVWRTAKKSLRSKQYDRGLCGGERVNSTVLVKHDYTQKGRGVCRRERERQGGGERQGL